jgi:hypothetical protein
MPVKKEGMAGKEKAMDAKAVLCKKSRLFMEYVFEK